VFVCVAYVTSPNSLVSPTELCVEQQSPLDISVHCSDYEVTIFHFSCNLRCHTQPLFVSLYSLLFMCLCKYQLRHVSLYTHSSRWYAVDARIGRCKFHRKQAWNQNFANKKNKDKLLPMYIMFVICRLLSNTFVYYLWFSPFFLKCC